MYSRDELLLRSIECYFGVYKHQNNPLVSAETVHHESTYIILYVCKYNLKCNWICKLFGT